MVVGQVLTASIGRPCCVVVVDLESPAGGSGDSDGEMVVEEPSSSEHVRYHSLAEIGASILPRAFNDQTEQACMMEVSWYYSTSPTLHLHLNG